MKLGICCNFTYPSCGGSETVCKAIAEHMVSDYGMEVITFGYNVEEDFVHNGVLYKKCLKDQRFLAQINDLDHLFIYSDSFWGFATILTHIDSIKPSLSIALLGMYKMIENQLFFNMFKKNRKRFKIITHSNNYQDYKKCFDEKIPVTVIPNGVDEEFTLDINGYFKEKYNIETSDIILNVSNYFYGKGQRHLIDIGNELLKIRGVDDFTIVQISSTIKYPHDKMSFNKTQNLFKQKGNFKYKFLRDIPREDVVSAFSEAKVSVLTSLKEVSPIVILESMVSQTPWVSMDVGNVNDLWGGTVICNHNHDEEGYKIFDNSYAVSFAKSIHTYLNSNHAFYEEVGVAGSDMISLIYNWDAICEQYYNIFID